MLIRALFVLILWIITCSCQWQYGQRFRPSNKNGKSCKYFNNGQIYYGPCNQKRNSVIYESEERPTNDRHSISYNFRPNRYKKPSLKVGPESRPNRGQNSGNQGAGIKFEGSGHGSNNKRGQSRPQQRPQQGGIKPNRLNHEAGSFAVKRLKYHGLGFRSSEPCTTSDGLSGQCSPASQCFYQFDDDSDLTSNLCPRNSPFPTVCCPVEGIREIGASFAPIKIPKIVRFTANLPQIDLATINEAAKVSQKLIKKQLELEIMLVKRGIIQTPNSAEAYHQAFFGGPDPVSRKLAKDGLIALETTLQLARKYELEKYQARDGLSQFSLFDTSIDEHCPRDPVCKQSKYRTIDGSCNNLEHPLWGKSHTAFIRLVPPDYADGLNTLRKASDGEHLPGPREVSITLATDVDIPQTKFTLMVMQWGQFIDHDITLTASTRIDSDRGEGIVCCREEFARNPGIRHPACKPISLPNNDPFFSKYDHYCTNFVRNAPSPRPGCYLGAREQANTLTHYIDGSMVYGSTADRAAHLRSFVGGQLRNSNVNGVEYLPFDTFNRSDDCAIQDQTRLQCFVGGDVRVNEQTGLTIMHMLFLREHNRIAQKLSSVNPQWNDEIIYQETRRLLAAIIQHITYNEWMPLILGRSVMKQFNLLPTPHGYSYNYDPSLNGAIINSFATAAYRFHTLIQGVYKLMNNEGKIINKYLLRNLFNNPTTVYERGAFDGYLNSLTAQPTQNFDQFFSQELTNHLFQEHDKPYGMDLISLNIQRGRDHGLPGYNAYRKVCGLPTIDSFEELASIMRQESAEKMAQLYRSVDDIDLFIAGNHELPVSGGVVGPTFACILGEQARRSKFGDRFWYENGDMLHSFTPGQLDEIRKYSLASVICANSDNIDLMQPLALVQPSEWNPKIGCDLIPRIDFSLWQSKKSQIYK